MTITHDQIPPEVVEAAARAAHQNWRESCSEAAHEPITNWQEWDDLTYDEQCDWLSEARAAIAAALNAWDGVWIVPEFDNLRDCIVLPLAPKEPGE